VFLNTGSNLTVRLSTTSANAPTCTQDTNIFDGFTAETNNLILTPGTCHPDAHAIVFSESGGGDPSASGYGIGEPHLATFYGVHYDFQAFGDFLLAQAGPNFIVQTRHKLLNPSISFNSAVATKMGDTRVAVCLPGRLEINGMPENLADGKAIAYGDVLVSRKGNTYEILGPGAAMVRATIAPALNWINVYVFPGGINREIVRGLLGTATGYPLDLAMRDGTVLPNPPSYKVFTDYAKRWRVDPADSLLCAAGTVVPGMPPKPTTAEDLSPAERERVGAICVRAGVQAGPLLEDCMLDVSMFGDNSAADAFRTAPQPIKEIRPTFP
jgi:hypothetical protein